MRACHRNFNLHSILMSKLVLVLYADVLDALQNVASVYKTAWVTTHSTYTAFKAKKRRRHATRHSALLAVGQQNQKNRVAQPPKPPPAVVPAPAEAGPPSQAPTARTVSLPPAATTYTQVQRPAAEDLLRSHNLTMRTGNTPLANTPQPLEKRPGTSIPRQSPGSFTVGYIAGDNVRQAHNLAERSSAMPVASGSSAATHAHADPHRSSHAVCGPVNLADMQLRSAHKSMGADVPGSDSTVGGMPRGGSPSSMNFARSMHSQRLPQPTKAQLQAHIHAQAQAQVRAQLEAAQAAAAAADKQSDGGGGMPAATRGPLSAAKLAAPIAASAGATGQGAGPLRDRQGWRGRDLGRQFGAMSGSAPAGGSTGNLGSGGGGSEGK